MEGCNMPTVADWIMVGITAIYVVATIFICSANNKSANASREQLVQQERISRITFVKELYMQLFSDPILRDFYYRIEWSDFTPTADVGFIKTADEAYADQLLSIFDLACNMYYRKILHEEDMEILKYEMLRFYEHPDTRSYLKLLTKWQERRQKGKSYESYIRYCDEQFTKDNKEPLHA